MLERVSDAHHACRRAFSHHMLVTTQRKTVAHPQAGHSISHKRFSPKMTPGLGTLLEPRQPVGSRLPVLATTHKHSHRHHSVGDSASLSAPLMFTCVPSHLGDTETGHDLVETEERTLLLGHLSQTLSAGSGHTGA